MMDTFISLHQNQLEFSNIPKHFWPTLYNKLHYEVLDVGNYFMMAQVVEEDEDENDAGGGTVSWKIIVNVNELKSSDPYNIFLIDHAWTYRPNEARQQLKNNNKLLTRMIELMNIDVEDCVSNDDKVQKVFNEMWKFNQTYSIENEDLGSESAVPIWYIMDEFGSRIQHSDNPTFKTSPFCYAPDKITYTVMWPLVDLKKGDEVTRNYINMPNISTKLKKYLLSPWIPIDDDDDDEEDNDDDGVDDDDEIFESKFSVHTSLPVIQDHYQDLTSLGRPIKVYTDVQQVTDHLKHPGFSLVDSWEEGDVIWTRHYLSNFESFSKETPSKLINQFPFEMVLTVKNMLPRVCKKKQNTKNAPDPNNDPNLDPSNNNLDLSPVSRSVNIDHEDFPNWLAVTFDLKNELPKFFKYFWKREDMCLSNYWILKPYNLSRGLDVHITCNINNIIRIVETGPKIACLYIDDPVLMRREDVGLVKFDLRFIAMLTNVRPLKLAVHNKFLIRVANRSFSMDNFDEYEQHFTVMNYKKGTKMHIIACEEMESRFEKQYPHFNWKDVLSDIYGAIREMFARASSSLPPRGIGHSPQSRAIYGVDVMLKWNKCDGNPLSIQPVILECNFGPDNTRFLNNYPTFFDDIFETLFLNVTNNSNVTHLN